MQLTNKLKYSILALLALTKNHGSSEPLQMQEIEELQGLANRNLESLLTALKRGGLVKSIRGSQGGYFLAREPEDITILDVFNCVEDLDTLVSTKSTSPETIEKNLIQNLRVERYQAAFAILQKYTLSDLYHRQEMLRRVPMYYI
ncbi:Rrf2 family transcriptional regulator [Scytonema sp. UIC 10036]|uniref:Rrf2 family transcriptional regulator n=1 Tax=Scytonema sp. UIC 10036 TaxID=2304196 RepID=UPI0012DAC6FB|nr:Rrf2 family transcriptional regulator [Scytonema sp. UIC 10036]MUG95880.1 Rrf2 family transcriptional regulator [Scytonema sp. UIC 10036]